MKLNKKISALLSCILACSTINPSASAMTAAMTASDGVDEVDADEDEYYSTYNASGETSSVLPWLIAIGLVPASLAVRGGVKAGQRYHARNMLKGEAWDWTLSDSDKETLFMALVAIQGASARLKTIATKRIAMVLALPNVDNIKNNEEYCKLLFNIFKVAVCPDRILRMADKWNEVSKDFEHINYIIGFGDQPLTSLNNDLHALYEQSEKAVNFMNNVLNNKVSLSLNEGVVKKPLERSKRIVNFIDKVGPEACKDMILNSQTIQIFDDPVNGHRKNEILWFNQTDYANPRKKLIFSRDGDESLI